MFIIETDVIYAVMKREDPLKSRARLILRKARKLYCSSATLVEVLSVLKALGEFESIAPKIGVLGNLPNIGFLPVTPEIADKAARIHLKKQLTFFDSFYAATALALDATLVSSDTAFEGVPGLKYMPISEYVSEVLGESIT
ncbi:TPA: PIN domain-containing protein [Candidatus Bathyarchaeota archaeon]|nr:PIN domain-containing protein [Candidatus Bathyarchaeota archaeon]